MTIPKIILIDVEEGEAIATLRDWHYLPRSGEFIDLESFRYKVVRVLYDGETSIPRLWVTDYYAELEVAQEQENE